MEGSRKPGRDRQSIGPVGKGPQAVAAGLPKRRRSPSRIGAKSREHLYGTSIRISAERARDARLEADKLACIAWNNPMLGFQGPAQPSPMLGDALNAGFRYLEVRCAGCDLHSTVDLTIVRRPKETTPIHELERRLACKDCSQVRGYRYKRGQLVGRIGAAIGQAGVYASRRVEAVGLWMSAAGGR